MGYAFISYSTKNQSSADAMRHLFKKNNIDTWMAPYDIPVGSEYTEILHDALTGCSCLVLMLTDASQNSIWVKKEVNIAITNGKTIIPIKLEDIELNKSMTVYLVDQQIIPVHTVDEKSEEIQKVLNRVLFFTGETKETDKTLPVSKVIDDSCAHSRFAEWVRTNGIPNEDNRHYYYKMKDDFCIICPAKSNSVMVVYNRILAGLLYSVVIILENYHFEVSIDVENQIYGFLDAKYYSRKSSLLDCAYDVSKRESEDVLEPAKQALDLCIESIQNCLKTNNLPITIADLGFESFE